MRYKPNEVVTIYDREVGMIVRIENNKYVIDMHGTPEDENSLIRVGEEAVRKEPITLNEFISKEISYLDEDSSDSNYTAGIKEAYETIKYVLEIGAVKYE